MRIGNINAAIASKQSAIRKVQEQIDKGVFSDASIAVLRKLKAAHEASLAKLLADAPEKVTAKGEAE